MCIDCTKRVNYCNRNTFGKDETGVWACFDMISIYNCLQFSSCSIITFSKHLLINVSRNYPNKAAFTKKSPI